MNFQGHQAAGFDRISETWGFDGLSMAFRWPLMALGSRDTVGIIESLFQAPLQALQGQAPRH